MGVIETYIADGGFIRLVMIGFVVYMYLKMEKRVIVLNEKIDFLKEGIDDLQKQIHDNKQKIDKE